MSRTISCSVFCLVLWAFAACTGRPSTPAIAHYLDLANESFSGDSAMEIVEFMENTWRVPGNGGFDSSIQRVVDVLKESGYVEEENAAPGTTLTYRIERRPMNRPTWEPIDGSMTLLGDTNEVLLDFSVNRNMIAINSYSTPPEGVEAELVFVQDHREESFEGLDVRGKIVFGETSAWRLFREAVQRRGALGVVSYSMPAYNRPEENPNTVQFSSIPHDSTTQSWGVRISYAVCDRLKRALEEGTVRVRVSLQSRVYWSEELTLIADVIGRTHSDERFVISAHVQEPGANDNASGVAVQAEIARFVASLIDGEQFEPARSISMIWGDEISSIYRYIAGDSARAAGIRWGLSLDMVGEDTDKTGGPFRIERMPDPSAVWTRGADEHTEWGGRPLTADDLFPHYFNDFLHGRCLDRAAHTDWVVETNPYEGGSDHVPFLRAGIPGLLLWHFTDVYYHTDGDRLEMVSAETMANVGVCTSVSALTLASADGETSRFAIREVETAAFSRLTVEHELSQAAIAAGEDRDEQLLILQTWIDWYVGALRTTEDIEVGGSSEATRAAIEAAVSRVVAYGEDRLATL